MKFGKFEISEFCIGAILVSVILFLVLHYTLAEEELKEKTEQLQLEKEIILLEKERGNENGK